MSDEDFRRAVARQEPGSAQREGGGIARFLEHLPVIASQSRLRAAESRAGVEIARFERRRTRPFTQARRDANAQLGYAVVDEITWRHRSRWASNEQWLAQSDGWY